MKHLKIMLALLLALLLLTACGNPGVTATEPTLPPDTTPPTQAEPKSLWIVTSSTEADQYDYQIKKAIAALEEKYPGIEIKVDYLPGMKETFVSQDELILKESDKQRIAQLRQQAAEGSGPDVFLFPTDTMRYATLCDDVTAGMRDGMFADLTAYYNADTSLTAGLNSKVMDAGVWDGKRYVLPLRYDMGVYTYDPARLAESGWEPELLKQAPIQEVIQAELDLGEAVIISGAFPYAYYNDKLLSYFKDPLDYATGTVNIDQEKLAELLGAMNGLWAAPEDISQTYVNNRRGVGEMEFTYFFRGEESEVRYFDMGQKNLEAAFGDLLALKADGVDGELQPVRGVDGATSAWITWYGAVSAGCEDPGLAYEYLRLFLTEEYQWETGRPSFPTEVIEEHSGILSHSWPVRDKGAAEKIWTGFTRSYRHESSCKARIGMLEALEITDADAPFVQLELDSVYFPIPLERALYRDYFPVPNDSTWEELDRPYPDPQDPQLLAGEIIRRLENWIAPQ